MARVQNKRKRKNRMAHAPGSSNPLLEVFGFPTSNLSDETTRYRDNHLCPYNNNVPSCTKDKAKDPLGVCSINDNGRAAITCPVRFRERWIIAGHAAEYFFPPRTAWTSLTEIRLTDKHGQSAGNIDLVMVSYDKSGKITDFGALEIQAVYISGNVRRPFERYMGDPKLNADLDWTKEDLFPRADYLSSSRKRLVPQLIYKGGILNSWHKKIGVVLHEGFYATLPPLKETPKNRSDMAWFIYGLDFDRKSNTFQLALKHTKHTKFDWALEQISTTKPGKLDDFVAVLQHKLDEKLSAEHAPVNRTLFEQANEGDE